MSLLALQRDFRRWLIDLPVTMEYWVDEDARAGLDVYHNAYRVQLTECLRGTFEKTLLWIGEDAFIDAARIHIERTPPHGWTLGAYGDGFDRTLAELYPDDSEVTELAWLDHALGRAFESPDATPIAPEALADVDWDNARLSLTPTLQIADAHTNAGAIWSALAAEETPPAPAMLSVPGAMLIWRQEFTPCFRTVEAVERDALTLILAGISFGALCAMLIDRRGAEQGVAQAAALLGQWIGEGLILSIDPEEKEWPCVSFSPPC
jgi:hypothetical protein